MDRRRPTSWVRGWDFWGLSTPLRLYLAAVALVWGLGLVWALLVMPYRISDLAVFALLTTCGAVAVEAQRAQGEPSGLTKDLLSAWWLPIAFALPPAYSLLAPVLLTVQSQLRVRRMVVYRRVFSLFANGLTHALTAVAFAATVRALGDPGVTKGWAVLGWAGAALVCAALASFVNGIVFAVAIKLSSPEETWRDLLSRDSLTIDIGEFCTGVMLAILAMLNPLLLLIAVVPVVLLQRVLMHDQLTAAARTDPKTGLLNALAWEREAGVEISRASRSRTPLSVMLLDLDHFKQVNDQHGHLVGDEVLRKVAAVMREQTREYDSCARFGGDEFAVLLPNSDLAEARATATRILRNVDEIRVVVGSDVVGTSVSIGVADLTHRGEGVTDLLAAADLALYRAKSAGRHQLG